MVCVCGCVLCVCGCVREENDEWVIEEKLEGHNDWVRDVAWCPSIGLPISRIASCSQVRCVFPEDVFVCNSLIKAIL